MNAPKLVAAYVAHLAPTHYLVVHDDGSVWYHDRDTGQHSHRSELYHTDESEALVYNVTHLERVFPSWMMPPDPRLAVPEGL